MEIMAAMVVKSQVGSSMRQITPSRKIRTILSSGRMMNVTMMNLKELLRLLASLMSSLMILRNLRPLLRDNQ